MQSGSDRFGSHTSFSSPATFSEKGENQALLVTIEIDLTLMQGPPWF
jgi:hypothetical protein